MEDIDSIYPTKFLEPDAVKEKEPLRLTIDKAEVEESKFMDKNNKPKRQVVLSFIEIDKIWSLNKTNAKKITETLGKDFTQWPSGVIEIYTVRKDVMGEEKLLIRVKEAKKPEVKPSGSIFSLTKGVEVV